MPTQREVDMNSPDDLNQKPAAEEVTEEEYVEDLEAPAQAQEDVVGGVECNDFWSCWVSLK
jgi:hypothetical protein